MKIERFNKKQNRCWVYYMKYYGTKMLYTDIIKIEHENLDYDIYYKHIVGSPYYDFDIYIFCYNYEDMYMVSNELKFEYNQTLDYKYKNEIIELKKDILLEEKEDNFKEIKKDDIELLISSDKFNL